MYLGVGDWGAGNRVFRRTFEQTWGRCRCQTAHRVMHEWHIRQRLTAPSHGSEYIHPVADPEEAAPEEVGYAIIDRASSSGLRDWNSFSGSIDLVLSVGYD